LSSKRLVSLFLFVKLVKLEFKEISIKRLFVKLVSTSDRTCGSKTVFILLPETIKGDEDHQPETARPKIFRPIILWGASPWPLGQLGRNMLPFHHYLVC